MQFVLYSLPHSVFLSFCLSFFPAFSESLFLRGSGFSETAVMPNASGSISNHNFLYTEQIQSLSYFLWLSRSFLFPLLFLFSYKLYLKEQFTQIINVYHLLTHISVNLYEFCSPVNKRKNCIYIYLAETESDLCDIRQNMLIFILFVIFVSLTAPIHIYFHYNWKKLASFCNPHKKTQGFETTWEWVNNNICLILA